MESVMLVSESRMAMGSSHPENSGSCNDARLMSKDPGLTWARPVNAMLAAQGVRRSSRRKDDCGCRLASALAGTGDSGSAAPGAIEGALLAPEMLADGAAAGGLQRWMQHFALQPMFLPSAVTARSKLYALAHSNLLRAWPHVRQPTPTYIPEPLLSQQKKAAQVFHQPQSVPPPGLYCWR